MASIKLQDLSYTLNDELQISLDFKSSEILLSEIQDIRVTVFLASRERDNKVLEFGHETSEIEWPISITHRLNFPENFNLLDGLYFIVINVTKLDENIAVIRPADNGYSMFFWFAKTIKEDLSKEDLIFKIEELISAKNAYINFRLETPSVKGNSSTSLHRVLIFGEGCLLHSSQVMEGFSIHPLDTGYSYLHMLNAVNSYTRAEYELELDIDKDTEKQFGHSKPLIVIDFHNVLAVNIMDAKEYCSLQSEPIFTALAYHRGQRPNSFATIVIDLKTNQISQEFHFSNYKGNFLSDFTSSITANILDSLLHKSQNSAWLSFIMRIYSDAQSDEIPHHKCLKLWSILEIISEKKVLSIKDLYYPDGEKITDEGGKVVTTKYALGKVYQHVMNCEVPPSVNILHNGDKLIFETYEDGKKDPNYTNQTQIVKLWELLSALYEIRNSTAHSGEFDVEKAKTGKEREKLAAELWELEHKTFLHRVESLTKDVISKELNDT